MAARKEARGTTDDSDLTLKLARQGGEVGTMEHAEVSEHAKPGQELIALRDGT